MHLDKLFNLKLYEVGDQLQIYSYQLNSGFYFNLEFHSEQNLIEPQQKLINLITQENIWYLQFSLVSYESNDVIESYCYRPLVAKKDRNY